MIENKKDKNLKIKYLGVIFLAVFIWSTAYPVNRYLALGETNPYLIAFCRAFFSMAVCLFILLLMRKPPSLDHFTANWPVLLGMALTGVVGLFLSLAVGLQYVSAGKASLINSINPALIVLLAHFIFHESLGKQRIAGLVLSLACMILVITGNDFGLWYHLSFQAVDLIFVFSGLGWAIYSILNRFLGNRIGYIEGLFWVFALAAVFLLPTALIFWKDLMLFSGENWLWLIYLGIFCGAFGNYLWYIGIVKVGAANAGLINSMMPFCAIIISYFTLSEILTPIQFVGSAILVFGVWLGLHKDSPRVKNINSKEIKI
ncbi:MAG: DMT family transporter [Desulfitobacteriaceae bacterium]|nr:DMT family transporter [Desulfitobacteriaceae bacterium]